MFNKNRLFAVALLVVVVLLSLLFSGWSLWGHDTELQLEALYNSFEPIERFGIRAIEIERSRKINCFGFLGVKEYGHRLDYREMQRRGAAGSELNQITIKVEEGKITDVKVGGSKKTRVDEYLVNVIRKWQEGDQRFTSFLGPEGKARFEKVEFLIKLYHDGRLQIKLKDFDINQPEDAETSYKEFYAISLQRTRMRYLIPFEGFTVLEPEVDPGIRKKFNREIQLALVRWKARKLPRPTMPEGQEQMTDRSASKAP